VLITKEAVEKRLEGLRRRHEELVATANAVSGHIAEAEYWLSVLNKEGADMKLVKETAELGKAQVNAEAN